MKDRGGVHFAGLLGLLALVACADEPGGQDDPLEPATDLTWSLHESIESLVYLSWIQPGDATSWVEFTFDEDEWLTSPATERAAGEHSEMLLGIPYETTLTAHVVVERGGEQQVSEEVTATTGVIPEELPLPELLVAESDLWEPTGRYMLGSINPSPAGWFFGHYWMFVVDRQGRVVWARRGEGYNFTIYLQISRDNDILWDEATFWSSMDNGAASKVHRMKIDGVVTASYDTPGLHHAFRELPDGSLLWGSASTEYETLERLYPDGTRETVWDCTDFYQTEALGGWCHSNAIFHAESSDSLLVSLPDPDAVVEIGLSDGEVVDWWSHNGGTTFEPEDATFWFQHGTTFTDDGTLLLSTHAAEDDIDAVVREFQIDGQALTQVWSHGVGDEIAAEYAGEAHRLPGGNTLHNTGTTPRVREITPDGTVAWDIAWEGYRLIGRTVLLEDLYALAP